MAQIRCREIREADLDRVADLLTRGFAGRSRDYWMQGLRRQAARRDVPEGYPRFGYMLDREGAPAGVLLLLYTRRRCDGELTIHCNLSSWYVEPAFRNYAPMLTKMAQRRNEVTYFNISPAAWTWPIIEAQGFSAYCKGLFFSFPLLARSAPGITSEIVAADTLEIAGLPATELELLARHAAYGCLSLVCRTATHVMPFVLLPMRIRRGWISPPAMQLIYCRDVADYVACAGAIGKALLRRGKVSVFFDANGPVEGMAGFYTEKRGRKYCKGPHRPRLADLSDTELVLYGP
ncbi:MAG: acyl-CoA acyltransferase [Bradyrhizobium sp.]|nr:acyl-CoA acyltransferase [Bradyrhizobium sp.]